MTPVIDDSLDVRAKLESLQALLDELRHEYVNGINGPDDYVRAARLLDELTDGHQLNCYEERILIELEDAILTYERDGEQLQAFNAAIKARTTPVQLLRDLMETLKLTGSDLPEIGDKTVVSKVLNGERQISHKMAFALADRFGMHPKTFAPLLESDSDDFSIEVMETAGVIRLIQESMSQAYEESAIMLAPLAMPSARLLPLANMHHIFPSPHRSALKPEPKPGFTKVIVGPKPS